MPEIFRGDFSPKWVHLCRSYLTVIFFRDDFLTKVRVRPFVPGAICARDFNKGDFLHPVAWDLLCPKRTILPENNFCCFLPTCCCFAPFLICLLLFIYIFIQLVLFCLLVGSFGFLFQMCSSQGCGAISLPHSRITCRHGLERVQETVHASKAEGTIRTYLADFKRWKLWALSNGFCHMPANTFHVAVYLQCVILKQILLLLHLMLFTVLTGFNAWPVCRGFLTLSFLP